MHNVRAPNFLRHSVDREDVQDDQVRLYQGGYEEFGLA